MDWLYSSQKISLSRKLFILYQPIMSFLNRCLGRQTKTLIPTINQLPLKYSSGRKFQELNSKKERVSLSHRKNGIVLSENNSLQHSKKSLRKNQNKKNDYFSTQFGSNPKLKKPAKKINLRSQATTKNQKKIVFTKNMIPNPPSMKNVDILYNYGLNTQVSVLQKKPIHTTKVKFSYKNPESINNSTRTLKREISSQKVYEQWKSPTEASTVTRFQQQDSKISKQIYKTLKIKSNKSTEQKSSMAIRDFKNQKSPKKYNTFQESQSAKNEQKQAIHLEQLSCIKAQSIPDESSEDHQSEVLNDSTIYQFKKYYSLALIQYGLDNFQKLQSQIKNA